MTDGRNLQQTGATTSQSSLLVGRSVGWVGRLEWLRLRPAWIPSKSRLHPAPPPSPDIPLFHLGLQLDATAVASPDPPTSSKPDRKTIPRTEVQVRALTDIASFGREPRSDAMHKHFTAASSVSLFIASLVTGLIDHCLSTLSTLPSALIVSQNTSIL